MFDAILEMRPYEISFAKMIGSARHQIREKAGSKDTPSYAAARKSGRLTYDSETNHQLGALVEQAVARWLTTSWNCQVYEIHEAARYQAANIADVGADIEVKSCHGHHTVSLSSKDVGRGMQLWVGRPRPDFSVVEILGFLPSYDDAFNHREARPGHGSARLLPLELLLDHYPEWYSLPTAVIPAQREEEHDPWAGMEQCREWTAA